LENLTTRRWPAILRIDPGVTVDGTVWTSQYQQVSWTYKLQIPPERLPYRSVTGAVEKAQGLSGLSFEDSAANLLALMGREVEDEKSDTFTTCCVDPKSAAWQRWSQTGGVLIDMRADREVTP
jgi:hypothetical protein